MGRGAFAVAQYLCLVGKILVCIDIHICILWAARFVSMGKGKGKGYTAISASEGS
jgi:hypothetical protein